MLSRTADSLYWLFRYCERADFVARTLDATLRLAVMPQSYGGERNEWEYAVATAGDLALFRKLYAQANEDTVRDFLAFNPANPSSIRNCIVTARENARSVRTALTFEMWDALNSAWLELKSFDNGMSRGEFSRFLDWVKQVVLVLDGSAYRTMLRNDAFWFTRLGTAIERADNTGRLLLAKHEFLSPEADGIGSSFDYFQWTTVLRGVSALTAYHWVYRDSVKPWLVADLLILNREMPRSLTNCYEILARHLELIAGAYGRSGASQEVAGAVRDRLAAAQVEDVFRAGLESFVESVLADNNRLGEAVAAQYLI